MAAKKGRKLTPEHRRKISAALKGRKRTPEHSAKVAAARRGRPLSPETRAKLSAANAGRKHTPETRAKVAAAGKGRKHTPEARAKMSAALKGHAVSPETRARISAAKKGRRLGPRSPEHRAKMSAALKGRKLSPEHRAKMSAIVKGRRIVPPDLADQFDAFLEKHRATRPGPATSPEPALPTIRLAGPGLPFYVDGKKKPDLSELKYNLLNLLLEAGAAGLTKGQINAMLGDGGWRRAFRELKGIDSDMDAILVSAGKSWRRYRALAVRAT